MKLFRAFGNKEIITDHKPKHVNVAREITKYSMSVLIEH